jgi:hypothetical protein
MRNEGVTSKREQREPQISALTHQAAKGLAARLVLITSEPLTRENWTDFELTLAALLKLYVKARFED